MNPTKHAQRARKDIASRALRGASLRERILSVPERDRDTWLDDVLGLQSFVEDLDLPPGGVPYLPCPLRLILSAVDQTDLGADDVFVDLGAGLGRVAMVAHLLTGASAIGIEAQGHLVAQGRRACQALALTEVQLVHANAEDVALTGTVFFLYSPFNGQTLARVVSRIEALARTQRVTVCSIDLDLPALDGFTRQPSVDAEISIYRSIS